ncbi:MAG: DUF2752 domain-containing protein [Bacilli bacterium]|nr:DUF2752 domain-containing protein [Bacilli bacterium]
MQLQSLKKLVIVTNKKPSLRQGFFLLGFFLFSILWFLLLNTIHYQCPWVTLFHVYCPGCGGMRMILALLRLDFYQAFRYNPLLFILFILGFIYIIFLIIIYKKKKVLVLPSKRFWIVLLVILLIYMVLRNIDAFVYLIPTEV